MFIRLLVLVGLLASTAAWAQESKPIEITLTPKAIESPVLKHRLFPEEWELKEGNAAPILLRLPWEQQHWMQQVSNNLHEWVEKPLNDPAWKDFGNTFPDRFVGEMKRAAFRRDAKWEYPIGEQPLYFILLPDAQQLRMFLGHGLAAKIRYHLTRGEVNEAREGILIGFANARHISQTPFYINQLVAVAIHRTMLEQTKELIAHEKSPNLYWALSVLPDSLVQFDKSASFEGNGFAMTFPAANDLDRPREEKEWRKMAEQLIELLIELRELPALEKAKPEQSAVERFLEFLATTGAIHRTTFVKHARAELPKLMNVSAEKVAAMSDEEAGIRWYVHLRLEQDQRAAAILRLPPREAWPRLAELQSDIDKLREKTGGQGLGFLNPSSIYASTKSIKRRIDALRIIEAVRHHLATNEGKFPQRLEEIKSLSIPIDVLTDKPFEWHVEGKTATLKTPSLSGLMSPEVAKAHDLEFRLRVR